MTLDVRTPRGARAAPLADEVAALLVALAVAGGTCEPDVPAAEVRISRWRAAGRAYDD